MLSALKKLNWVCCWQMEGRRQVRDSLFKEVIFELKAKERKRACHWKGTVRVNLSGKVNRNAKSLRQKGAWTFCELVQKSDPCG